MFISDTFSFLDEDAERNKPCIYLRRRTERNKLCLPHKQNANAAGASRGDLSCQVSNVSYLLECIYNLDFSQTIIPG